MSDIILIDSYDFEDKIYDGVIMLIFSQAYHPQSRAMVPIFEEIAEEYYERVKVFEVDIEQSPDIAWRFSIESIPSVAMICDGKLKELITGANPPSMYIDALESILSES